MNDQPREEKAQAPEGAEQPTVEQPTGPGDQTAVLGQPPAAAQGAGEPGAAGTRATPAAGASAADQTAAHGQQPPPGAPGQAPPTPQLSQPGPGQPYGAWGAPQPPRQPGGFRRFVGHRATQLVGVGVLGLLVGGGIVGGIAAATHHGPRDGRPGIHRQYNGPQQGDNGRGFGHRGGGGNSGNSGNSGGGI